MQIAELITYLRHNVSIQSEEADSPALDPNFLNMTDDQLSLYVKVAVSRDFPSITSFEAIPEKYLYPVILLSKKELYFALAMLASNETDIEADGASLSREQRFKNYMSLIADIDKEYNQYNKDGGASSSNGFDPNASNNTLTSFEVLLPQNALTKRYQDIAPSPTVVAKADHIYLDSLEVSWECVVSRFYSYSVYVSEAPIWDVYTKKVSEDATLVGTIREQKNSSIRIEGLTEATSYHVLVVCTSNANLKGVHEIIVNTLTPEE